MKAVLGERVLAEAPTDQLVKIEGNWYFPPSSVTPGMLEESPTPYNCHWKGDCQYFSVRDGEQLRQDLAWSYPKPYPAAFERVGTDFSGYVAFSNAVTVAP